jgi:hypothetical protein
LALELLWLGTDEDASWRVLLPCVSDRTGQASSSKCGILLLLSTGVLRYHPGSGSQDPAIKGNFRTRVIFSPISSCHAYIIKQGGVRKQDPAAWRRWRRCIASAAMQGAGLGKALQHRALPHCIESAISPDGGLWGYAWLDTSGRSTAAPLQAYAPEWPIWCSLRSMTD